MIIFRRGGFDIERVHAAFDALAHPELCRVRGALYGHSACPADEIWLNDSDIVVVPKSPILVADDMINLIFTRGVYGVVPFQGVAVNFAKLATI